MSWKLTKKLKETHLAPISNPFSRSSSTSTIVPESDASSATLTAQSTTASSNEAPASTDPRNIAASSAEIDAEKEKPIKPGILVVTVHEGTILDFVLSESEQARLEGREPQSESIAANGTNGQRPNSTSFISSPLAPNGDAGRPKTSGSMMKSVPRNHGRVQSKYLPYAVIQFDKQDTVVPGVSGTPEKPQWAGNSTQYKFDVSQPQEIAFSVYFRNPNVSARTGRQQDIFIGSCRVMPDFNQKVATASGKGPERGHIGVGDFDIRCLDAMTGRDERRGSLSLGLQFVENQQRRLTMDDFELLKVVGKGSFGKVMTVRKKDTKNIYACKVITKKHIIARSEVEHTLAERSVLAHISNPFIVPLKFAFQSPEKLYLVLAFVNGGELFYHLQNDHTFSTHRARFYTAELVCALECLHGSNVIYRDLKPENILIDYTGHIALCDFGLCKLRMRDGDRTNTFCGTPEYLAPEVLNGRGYDKAVDWWTLGVLLFEMLNGLPPYYSTETTEMYKKISQGGIERIIDTVKPFCYADRDPQINAARDLVLKLLAQDPEQRLGSKSVEQLKAHKFFDKIDWKKLLARKYEAPFKPNVRDQLDTANFDPEFTSEPPKDSVVESSMLSDAEQAQFDKWSYARPVAGLGDAGGSVKDPSFESYAR